MTTDLLVIVHLRDTLRDSYDRDLDTSPERYPERFDFMTMGVSGPLDACETAFAVCNSHPDELHCHKRYLKNVRKYRADGHRSLSVGDVVEVVAECGGRGTRYVCASFGFDKIEERADI